MAPLRQPVGASEPPRGLWRLGLLGRGLDGRGGLTVVAVLELGRWDEADLAVESSVVEPVDVFEGGELDVVEAAPGSSGIPPKCGGIPYETGMASGRHEG